MSLKMGHPFFVTSSIFELILFWVFTGQSSAAYAFNFAASVDVRSSSSGKFPINCKRNGLRFSSNFQHRNAARINANRKQKQHNELHLDHQREVQWNCYLMFWFSRMKHPQWLDLCGNNAAKIFSLFFFFAKSSQSGLNGSISEDNRSATTSVTPQLCSCLLNLSNHITTIMFIHDSWKNRLLKIQVA